MQGNHNITTTCRQSIAYILHRGDTMGEVNGNYIAPTIGIASQTAFNLAPIQFAVIRIGDHEQMWCLRIWNVKNGIVVILRTCSRIWQYRHYCVLCNNSLYMYRFNELVYGFLNYDSKTQSVHALSGRPNSQRMLNSNLNLRFLCQN